MMHFYEIEYVGYDWDDKIIVAHKKKINELQFRKYCEEA
jgi:hypothetical protein